MASKISFTKLALESLITANPGKRLVAHDSRQPGLIADLRPGGSLSFYLYRWANGRPHRLRIGAFPEVTVENAREQARLLIADLTRGLDPAAIKRARRKEATVGELFDHWLDSHAKKHKRTWSEDQRQFDRFLLAWKNRRLSTITSSDVRTLHARIGEHNGHYAANRLLALIRAMFNRAGEDQIGYSGVNPTIGVKKFREESRDRSLQVTELPAFFSAVEAEPDGTLRDFFKICLFTGARRGNVAAMAWSDVDLAAATWRIPITKSGEPVIVHLSAPALEILRSRHAIANGTHWVFPGGKKNRAGHLSCPKTAWSRLVTTAGLKDLRLHDLRRTLGSFQAAAGASLPIIGKSLGHKSIASTAVYARLNLDPVRASVDVATAAILRAAKPPRVKAMRRRKVEGRANE